MRDAQRMVQADGMRHAGLVVLGRDHPDFPRQFRGDGLHDGQARRAITRTLPAQYRDVYGAAVGEFAGRPLEDGVGLQTHIAVRKQRGMLRSTISLAAEAYAVESPGEALPASAASVC